MASTTRVSSSLKGTVGILQITGDVTDQAEPAILNSYREVTSKGAKGILLLFNPKSFMNSSGIRVVITLAFQAEKSKQQVCATGLSPHMAEVFELVGLTKYLQISPSEQAAMKYLKSE